MRTKQGKYSVGTVHQTKNSGQIEIIGRVEGVCNRRTVRFIDTGFETQTSITNISQGRVKDPMRISVFGVGYLGHDPELEKHPLRNVLYKRWTKMIERVNVIKTRKSISQDWYCFYTFMRDALNLKGIELLYHHSKSNRIDLDSDIIAKEKGLDPMYSKDTCQWVKHADNMQSITQPKQPKRWPIGTVIETRHGPVTIMAKARESTNAQWLIRFSDGTEQWNWRNAIINGQFAKP